MSDRRDTADAPDWDAGRRTLPEVTRTDKNTYRVALPAEPADTTGSDWATAAAEVHRAFCDPEHELVGEWDREMAESLRRNGLRIVPAEPAGAGLPLTVCPMCDGDGVLEVVEPPEPTLPAEPAARWAHLDDGSDSEGRAAAEKYVLSAEPAGAGLDWEAMRREKGWPTPDHMHRLADALDMFVVARYGEVLRFVADACDAALPAEPAGAGLNVERLARALQEPNLTAHHSYWADCNMYKEEAAAIAAAYAEDTGVEK